MASGSAYSFVSQEEFVLFHRIDRDLYKILVINLLLDPSESMQIMGLWLWLERVGFCNLVSKILSLPHFLINELAEESLTCLNCINNTPPPPPVSSSPSSSWESFTDIPLLQSLTEKEMSLPFLYENRGKAIQGVAKVVEEVCARAFSDIMQEVVTMRTRILNSVEESSKRGSEVMEEQRTLFVTFSKGYRVEEWEVREFVRRRYGDCVEGVFMQEVKPNEQPLFARVVFHAPSSIDRVLKGTAKAKFTINGKHVWARKFVPKRPSHPSSSS